MLPYITTFGAFLSEETYTFYNFKIFKNFFQARYAFYNRYICVCMYVYEHTWEKKRISQSKGNDINLFFEIRLQNLYYMICSFIYYDMYVSNDTGKKS